MTIKQDQNILKAAVAVAQEIGLSKLTRHKIAKKAGVGYGTVYNHLGDMPETRDAVVLYAVENEILGIIADGISLRHPTALCAPVAMRQKALAALL